MQKIWFKSKRSQSLLPEEDRNISSPATEQSLEGATAPVSIGAEIFEEEVVLKAPPKSWGWQISPLWVVLGLGIGGIVIVTTIGLQYLTAPESTPDSSLRCAAKIRGEWQTPLGKVTLQEDSSNLVSGKYEYTNFERGRIVGEMTGKLNSNIFSFNWQETPNKQPKQSGKGVFIFAEGCKEFYGSYGTGESTSNFGNWRGSLMPKQK